MHLPVIESSSLKHRFKPSRTAAAGSGGFTLAEVVVCMAIIAVVFGGIITCYMQGADRAEWAGFNLSAQALAMQQIEQAKSAKWDSQANEITNLITTTSALLDLPTSGTNQVWATNFTTISLVTISAVPLIQIYMVKVDTQWPFYHRGIRTYFTNTVACYYAQDQ